MSHRPRPEPWIVRYVERWSIVVTAAVIGALAYAVDSEAAEKPNSATPGESCLLLVSGQTVWQITVPASTREAPIPENFCELECDKAMASKRAEFAPVKTSSSVRFTCRNDRSTTVSYQANPAPTCPGYGNLPLTRPGSCPAGTESRWEQTATYTQNPSTCTVTATWAPATAPSGGCTPIPVEPPPPPPPPSGPGVACLSWGEVTRNTDGSTLTNLAGYRIHMGLTATTLAAPLDAPGGASTTKYCYTGLRPSTYYFAVQAYTNDGRWSNVSNVQSKVVR